MKFIGISGPIASGKSTFAKALQSHIPNSIVIPFASGVKYLASLYDNPAAIDMITAYFMILNVQFEKAAQAALKIDAAYSLYPTEYNRKNRKLLQYIGTEVGREFVHPDIWLRDVLSRSKDSNCDVVICDDLRFPNEADFVDVHIAIDVESTPQLTAKYIQRIEKIHREYIYTDHASEQQILPKPDIVVPIDFPVSYPGIVAKVLHL